MWHWLRANPSNFPQRFSMKAGTDGDCGYSLISYNDLHLYLLLFRNES